MTSTGERYTAGIKYPITSAWCSWHCRCQSQHPPAGGSVAVATGAAPFALWRAQYKAAAHHHRERCCLRIGCAGSSDRRRLAATRTAAAAAAAGGRTTTALAGICCCCHPPQLIGGRRARSGESSSSPGCSTSPPDCRCCNASCASMPRWACGVTGNAAAPEKDLYHPTLTIFRPPSFRRHGRRPRQSGPSLPAPSAVLRKPCVVTPRDFVDRRMTASPPYPRAEARLLRAAAGSGAGAGSAPEPEGVVVGDGGQEARDLAIPRDGVDGPWGIRREEERRLEAAPQPQTTEGAAMEGAFGGM